MSDNRGSEKKRGDGLVSMLLEVFKWGLVIWLILPVQSQEPNFLDLVRVVTGILLFIIFTGKLFFDTVISDMIKQRRTSLKRDIITLLGLVLVIAIIIGFTIFATGLVLINMHQKMVSGE